MLMGIALSCTIYLSGRQLSSSTDSLITAKLPRLKIINNLKLAILEHERLLYEYYATTDQKYLLPLLVSTQSEFTQNFHAIELVYSDRKEIEVVRKSYEMIHSLAAQLDITLSAESVDWDRARELLVEISSNGRSIGPALDKLVMTIDEDAQLTAEKTQKSTNFSHHIGYRFQFGDLTYFRIGGYLHRPLYPRVQRAKTPGYVSRAQSKPCVEFELGGTSHLRQSGNFFSIGIYEQSLGPPRDDSAWRFQ